MILLPIFTPAATKNQNNAAEFKPAGRIIRVVANLA